MALNALMHPRNPYKLKRPDFKILSSKYEFFRNHASTDQHGRVHIDFKSPECLKALTWALLKEDFDLDIDIPLDRLIPTVPLRLNYILWLEDILEVIRNCEEGADKWAVEVKVNKRNDESIAGSCKDEKSKICGIDIGMHYALYM